MLQEESRKVVQGDGTIDNCVRLYDYILILHITVTNSTININSIAIIPYDVLSIYYYYSNYSTTVY